MTRSAKMYYFPPTCVPVSQAGCNYAETANYRLPGTSISDSHVYFLDADTVFKSMAVDGTVAVVKTVHAPPNSQVAFSVSPDDRRIAISIITLATSQSPEPVDVNMYVEDLTEQTNRVSLYSSKTLAEWPIGWHAGDLVVAVGSQDFGPYANSSAATGYGNPYAAIGYQVVDPATGHQLATLDCARGLLVGAGTACASGFCPSGTSCGPGTLGLNMILLPSRPASARLGFCSGGGSTAARAVAACILIDGSFDGLPAVLAEGRRVIGNVERLASLFFTKTVYAFLLAIAVGVATLPFPFLPRQLTLISAFTIGIPSVYLALSPSFQPSHLGFLGRVLRFSVPAGVVAGAATFAAYALAVGEPDISISEERTIATVVIASIGLWVLARIARPLTAPRGTLVVAMACGLGLMLLLQPMRKFFDLDFPRLLVLLAAIGIVTLAILVLEAIDRIALSAAASFGRRRGIDPQVRP